jgi:hypothetical protein
MFEGSTISATGSAVTVTAVTVPVYPPDAVPLMLEDPGVVVDCTVPGADELLLAPAGIVVAEPIRTQQTVLLDVSEMTIADAATTGAPSESTARAVMLLVAAPSAPMLAGFALRMTCAIRVSNVAPTVLAALMRTEHPPVPEHAPLHPTKAEAESAVAKSWTDVPSG